MDCRLVTVNTYMNIKVENGFLDFVSLLTMKLLLI